MTEKQFNEITDWQDKTFPESTEFSRVKHLIKEVQELETEVVLCNGYPTPQNLSDKHQEYADCFFLLFGAAKKAGMSYDDICRAIDYKFQINKNRIWGKPDVNGVVEHLDSKRVCKGSMQLGTGCGKCERCSKELRAKKRARNKKSH